MSAPVTSHGLLWLGLMKCKTCSAIFLTFSTSSFMLTQYIDSSARSFVFSIPMWLIGVVVVPIFFSISGMITHLAFIMNPTITAMSSLNNQYILMSCCTWYLTSSHPAMIYPLNHYKCSYCAGICCICAIDMHYVMFVDICIASTLTSMPHISSSLFSMWLCLDSQSVMESSGPSLYIILTPVLMYL